MIIKPFLVGHMSVFCYVLICNDTSEAVIIDPGGDTEKTIQFIKDGSLHVRYIFNTHNHPDHTSGNRRVKEETGAQIVVHEHDVSFMDDPERTSLFLRLHFPLSDTPPADIKACDGTALCFGKQKVTVIHTPGHSPGGMCLLCRDNLFTGDTLFVGGAGRLDLPGSNFHTLLNSLKEKIASLPAETIIWPGHDYGDTPVTTLAREKRENPYLGGQW